MKPKQLRAQNILARSDTDRFWIKKNDKRLISLRAQNTPWSEIALELGRSENACRKRHPKAVTSDWTEEDDSSLIRLIYKKRKDWKEAANELGRTYQACKKRYCHLAPSG